MNCIFCKVVDKSLDAKLIFEDDEVLAFRDISPQTPDHILIIPKKHITSLNHTQTEDVPILGKLLKTSQMLANSLGHSDLGYRVVINTGSNGGQTVEHLHLHLLAGRIMSWPPG
jgi:histidine triad (HIT) family protein